MKTESFEFESAPRERFIELPFRLYAGDARWVPPLKVEVARSLSPENLFLRHGKLRSFLVSTNDGKTLGRCTAMVNDGFVHEGDPTGMIGFFEAENDPAVSHALLSAASNWLREQGMRRVIGPMNFSIWHGGYRFMTRGFDCKPFHGEPYNPPFYPAHFEGFGFKPFGQWASWDLTEADSRTMLVAAEATAVPDAGYRPDTDAFRGERFDDGLKRLHGILVEAFRENIAHMPIDFEEFASLYAGMRATIIHEILPLWLAPDGETVGTIVAFPDLGDLFRAVGGDASRLAEAAAATPLPDRLILHTMAFLKAHRRQGLVPFAIVPFFRAVLATGVPKAIGALAKEGPTIYAKTGPSSRQYALYQMAL